MPTIPIPEQVINGEFFSTPDQANNMRDFSFVLASSVWTTQPGVSILFEIQQSLDLGATWLILDGIVALSGPLGVAPHNSMPGGSVAFPQTRGNSRIRVHVITPEPFLLGAVVTFNA